MHVKEAKVYHDGSHYIAIPKTKRPKRKKKQQPDNKCKEQIEKVLNENKKKPKKERIEIAVNEVNKVIKNESIARDIVLKNVERINRSLIERRKRLSRKANLQQWNYFCTFTYDSNKLTEQEFRIKFLNCIRHLANRNGWKYIGVFEKSPTKERLHFHGLFYTPIMIGVLIEKKDYSTKNHVMQITHQNTFFLKRFGRNDFKAIPQARIVLSQTINYLMKYIQKTGEKIIYSKGLSTYFTSDILDCDVVCTIGQEDRKLLLFDDFNCLIEGEVIGKVSPEVINKMPKVN